MGRQVCDLTNKKFGKLTVISRDLSKPTGAGKSAYWICQCDCGNICSIRSDKLKNGITQSCGCYSKEIRTQIFLKDLTNQRFGKLKVLKRDLTKPQGKACFAYWICQCDCGNICSVRGDHLRNSTTQSCGCLNSKGEEKINKILKENNIFFKTQYTFNDLKKENLLRFDFAIFKNGKLVYLIEYQGEQHYIPYHFDTQERFEKRLEYDNAKKEYCKQNHIPLIIIPYTDFDKIDIQYLNKKYQEVKNI